MTTLDKLFNSAQRQRLSAAIARRVSCRSFGEPLSAADWAKLSYAAGRYRMPGARLHLSRVDESLFTGTILTGTRLTGCTAAAVVIADSTVSRSRVFAGILGEAFLLEAQSMGLGSCWVTGTYRKKLLNVPLREGEGILGVIALGHPAQESADPLERRRKPLAKLCKGDPLAWPDDLHQAALAVQAAPSSMNSQPWLMAWEPGCFTLDASSRQPIDLGIALCHAELALKRPHRWRFGQGWHDPAAIADFTDPQA